MPFDTHSKKHKTKGKIGSNGKSVNFPLKNGAMVKDVLRNQKS